MATIPEIEILPIWANYGDCIVIRIGKKYYLIDGGPTESLGAKSKKGVATRKRTSDGTLKVTAPDSTAARQNIEYKKAVWKYLFGFLTANATTGAKNTFELEGALVTHPDHDHVQGVLRLFEEFKPNVDPSSPTKAKFVFKGPLLLTRYFPVQPNDGRALYELMESYNFTMTSLISNPTCSLSGFGSSFCFHFLEGNDANRYEYYGVVFNAPASTTAQDGYKLSARAVPARVTEDDSVPNKTSIITTVASPPGTQYDYQAVLTGDCYGSRVLKMVRDKKMAFFQVPHHGSARNSLPREGRYIPPDKDCNTVDELNAFRVLLAYGLDKSDKEEVLKAQVLPTDITDFNKKFSLSTHQQTTLDVTLTVVGEYYVKNLNGNEGIVLPPNVSTSRAEYTLEKVHEALQAIENNINDSTIPLNEKFKLNSSLSQFFWLTKKQNLYQFTKTKSFQKIKADLLALPPSYDKAEKSIKRMNEFLDRISALEIAEFYKNVNSQIYFISASGKHGHPHNALLQGLLSGVSQQQPLKPGTKRVLLLTTGGVLGDRILPDPNVWSAKVDIRYLTYPHGEVNPLKGTMKYTEAYDPSQNQIDTIKKISYSLRKGHAAEYLRKCTPQVLSKSCEIVTKVSNRNLWLALKSNGTGTPADFITSHQSVSMEVVRWDPNTMMVEFKYGSAQITVNLEKELLSVNWYSIKSSTVDDSYLCVSSDGSTKWTTAKDATVFNIVGSSPAMKKSPPKLHLSRFRAKFLDEQTVEDILSGYLSEQTVKQLKSLDSFPLNSQSFLNAVLTFKGNASSSPDKETITVQLPTQKPSLMGTEVDKVEFLLSLPSKGSPSFLMEVTWGVFQLDFDLAQLLDVGHSIEEYLNLIGFDTPVDDCTMGDIVMLLIGSIITADSTSTTLLSASLAEQILFWKIDNSKSRVYGLKTSYPDHPEVISIEKANLVAQIPSSGTMINLGDYTVELQATTFDYVASERVYTVSAKAVVANTAGLKNNMILTTVAGADKTQIHFEFVSETNLKSILSFLSLDYSMLSGLTVPLVNLALDSIPLSGAGFTLEQTIQGNSAMTLDSVDFTLSFEGWKTYLPKTFTIPDDLEAELHFFVLFPKSTIPKCGIIVSFSSTIQADASDAFKMASQLSVFPTDNTMESAKSGYDCELDLYFQSSVEDKVVGTRLLTLFNALGLGAVISTLSTALPCIGTFFNNMTLHKLQLGYNTTSLSFTEFHIEGSVPYWNVLGNITIVDFLFKLDYKESLGWGCELNTAILVGDVTATAEFVLPVTDSPGRLSFKNDNHMLTVSYFLKALRLPDFSELPVIGDILSISITEVAIGFQVKDSTFSMFGFQIQFYLESADFGIFTVSKVRVILAYNKTEDGKSEISFSISGFVGDKVSLDISYEPKTKLFQGRILVMFDQSMSISDSVNMLVGDNTLEQNSAYSEIQGLPFVDISITLKINENKSLTLTAFQITLKDIIQIKNLNLSKLKLEYLFDDSTSGSELLSTRAGSLGLPAGSSLKLLTVLEDTNGPFGLNISFDCTTKSDDITILSAEIEPSQDKVASIRGFLKAVGLDLPPLPDSGADTSNNPSSDELFDLVLIHGSIAMQVKPSFTLKSFDITTATVGNGWKLLSNPDLILQSCYLQANYENSTLSAFLVGVLTVNNVAIRLSGAKTADKSEFSLVVADDDYKDLMPTVLGLSPNSQKHLTIPSDSGLPNTLPGSFTQLCVAITDEKYSLACKGTLRPASDWTFDLGFKGFTINSLSASLNWDRMRKESHSETKTTYSLKIHGDLQFGDILLNLAMEVGTDIDTVIQAMIAPSSVPQLKIADLVNDTLGFASQDDPPSDESPPKYNELLPNDSADITFNISAYVYFNLTQKFFLLYGQASIGNVLLVAGKLHEDSSSTGRSSSYGYAVTLTLENLSSFLPPLKDVEDIITVQKLSGSVVNFTGMDTAELVTNINKAKESLGSEASNITLPFDDLSIKPGTKTGEIVIDAGTSLYAELAVAHSGVFSKLIAIQNDGTLPADIIIYAAVSKDSMKTVFIAKVASITLFGAIKFSDIELEYKAIEKSSLSLTGYIDVPELTADKAFYGDLSVTDTDANFSLTGTQPTKIPVPLDMFGVTIEEPRLSMRFEFPEGQKMTSHYEVSGKVNFWSEANPPNNGNGDNPPKPSFTLDCLCMFDKGHPIIVDVSLPKLDNPLTISDFTYTLFGFKWSDIGLPEIGLYAGKIYYAKQDYTAQPDGFHYQKGYYGSCTTFIYKSEYSFVITVEIPLDKSGFRISGSTGNPFDLGIIKFCGVDSNGDLITDSGPSLSYSCIGNSKVVYLEAGIIFLDVNAASLKFGYEIDESQFVGTMTYPGTFLGVDKPSVSFAWSKEKGFVITDWGLGQRFPEFDSSFLSEFEDYLNKPTEGGCKAIIGAVIDKTIQTKFNFSFTTADASEQDPNDLTAFKITGAFEINVVGVVTIASVDLPTIIVHIPREDNLTMEKFADYVLKTITSNAGSVFNQLLNQHDKLTKLMLAVAWEKIATEAVKSVLASLVCRRVDTEELGNSLKRDFENSDSEENADKEEGDLENEVEEFEDMAIDDVFEGGEAFSGMGAAAAGIASEFVPAVIAAAGVCLGFLAWLISIFSDSETKKKHEKYEKMKRDANDTKERIKNRVESAMTMKGPLNITLESNNLTISWTAYPKEVSNVTYHIKLELTSPTHTYDPISDTSTTATWSHKSDNFSYCSKLDVSVYASCVIKGITYTGTHVLTKEYRQTPTIDPPQSVDATCSDPGDINVAVKGVTTYADSVEVQLLELTDAVKPPPSETNPLAKQIVKDENGSTNVNATFKPSDYWGSEKPYLMARARCFKEGFEISEFTNSTILRRLPPPTSVTHSLPLFRERENKITLKWEYPEDTTDLKKAFCDIVDKTDDSDINSFISTTVELGSNPPEMVNTAGFEVEQFLSSIPPKPNTSTYVLGYRVSFITSGTNSERPNSFYQSETSDFCLASTPTELSVVFGSEQSSIAISWLPVQETNSYQVEVLSKPENSNPEVVATQKYDPVVGPSKATRYLSKSNMEKMSPGNAYFLNLYSLGDDKKVLYNDVPSPSPDIYCLTRCSKVDATYSTTTDSISVEFAKVSKATLYKVLLLEYTQSGQLPNVITTATVMDSSQVEPSPGSKKPDGQAVPLTLTTSISLNGIHSQLSIENKYGIGVVAIGKPQDIPSAISECPKNWTVAPSPKTLSVEVNQSNRTLFVVSTPVIKEYSKYCFIVEKVKTEESKTVTVDATTANNSVETEWSNRDLPGSDNETGADFITKIQIVGTDDSIFNSDTLTGPTIITLLPSPIATSVQFGGDVKSVTATYSEIPKCKAVDFTVLNDTQHKVLGKVDDYNPPLAADSFSIKCDIDPSSIVVGDVIQVVSIAKGEHLSLNSLPGSFCSPPSTQATSPYARFAIGTSTIVVVQWLLDDESEKYDYVSIDVRNNKEIISRYTAGGTGSGFYQHNLFADTTNGSVTYEVTLHTLPSSTPNLASNLAKTNSLLIQPVIAGITVEPVPDQKYTFQWALTDEYTEHVDALHSGLSITRFIPQGIDPPVGATSTTVTEFNFSQGEHELFLMTYLIPDSQAIMGAPIYTHIDNGNYFKAKDGSGVTLSERNKLVTSNATTDAIACTFNPITVGSMFKLNIKTLGCVRLGLTTYSPEHVVNNWSDTEPMLEDENCWVWYKNSVWHHGLRRGANFNLNELSASNQSVGLAVLPDGRLHIYVDGKEGGSLWTGLPVGTPLYGIVDLNSAEDDNVGTSFMFTPMQSVNGPQYNYFKHHGTGVVARTKRSRDSEGVYNHITVQFKTLQFAVAYTSLAISHNYTLQFRRIDDKISTAEDIVIGFTVMSPNKAPIPENSQDLLTESQFFLWKGDAVYNNGVSKNVSINLDRDFTHAGQTAAVSMYPNGDIHVYIDGEDKGSVYFESYRPDHQQQEMFGLIAAYGTTTTVPNGIYQLDPSQAIVPTGFMCFDRTSFLGNFTNIEEDGITISGYGSTETESRPFGVAVTADLVPFGQIYQIRIPTKKNKTNDTYGFSLKEDYYYLITWKNDVLSHVWGNACDQEAPFDLRSLEHYETAGMAILPNHCIYLFRNGSYVGDKGKYRLDPLVSCDASIKGETEIQIFQSDHPDTQGYISLEPLTQAPSDLP